MKQKAFDRAQQLYEIIHQCQYDIKSIKYYEQKYFKSGVSLVLKVPHIVVPYTVDSNVVITDKELIKEVLNLVKIYNVKTIQNAEKELEDL